MNQLSSGDEDEVGGTPISKARRTPPPPQPQQMVSPSQQSNGMKFENPNVFTENDTPRKYELEQEQFIRGMRFNNNNNNSITNRFKKETFTSKINIHMKYSIIVAILFIILNSKIIWTQISKLPMMGAFEPSILALIFNSVLSGILFYFIIKFVK
jgi:hypothetical protein